MENHRISLALIFIVSNMFITFLKFLSVKYGIIIGCGLLVDKSMDFEKLKQINSSQEMFTFISLCQRELSVNEIWGYVESSKLSGYSDWRPVNVRAETSGFLFACHINSRLSRFKKVKRRSEKVSESLSKPCWTSFEASSNFFRSLVEFLSKPYILFPLFFAFISPLNFFCLLLWQAQNDNASARNYCQTPDATGHFHWL